MSPNFIPSSYARPGSTRVKIVSQLDPLYGGGPGS
jgi:hypothetical protein